jgi:hypothetical protein
MTKAEQKIIDTIKEYGWTVLMVMDRKDEPTGEPNFAYSIGMYETFGLPEILIIGLKPELQHVLINNIGGSYKSGLKLQSGIFQKDIIDNFDCLIVEVEKKYYEDYFGQALAYYGHDNFPVYQIVYPTTKGIFPWEADFPKTLKQPILGERLDKSLK